MANSVQARKRAKQNDKRRASNTDKRSMMRTFVKRVRAAIASGDKTQAQEAFKQAAPILDSMATRGLIHKNAAARYKSRMNAAVKAL